MASFNHVPNPYPFLSRPPPPQRTRPTQPLPATPCTIPTIRKRSYSAIAAWAALVQPGSPGSPHSPRRRPSIPRRTSASRRLTPSPRATSSSFIIVDTPTPSAKDFPIDLTELGYTSVFLHLPKTPLTPNEFPHPIPINPDSFPKPATRTIKSFRSITNLRCRSRSANSTMPPSPIKSTTRPPRSPLKYESPQILAASIAKRKKAVYAHAKSSKPAKPKPKHAPLPPSLASELALMQFADGGSINDNIKRLMEAQATAAAPAGTNSRDTAVNDVYRDVNGGIWIDREEEMEYVHLLGGHGPNGPEAKWVSFGGEVKDTEEELAIASLAGLARRDSTTSTNSNSSALDPTNIIKPAEEDGAVITVPAHIPVPTLASPPRRVSPALLSLPSRPRAPRQQHHLHGNPAFFLLDLKAFSVPNTPRTPSTPGTPMPRRPSLVKRSSPTRSTFTAPSVNRARAAHVRRRRHAPPPPLKIVPQRPVRDVERDEDGDVVMACASPVQLHTNKVTDADEAKREFLGDSFAPPVVVVPPPTTPMLMMMMVPPVAASAMTPGLKKKASRFGLIFGRK